VPRILSSQKTGSRGGGTGLLISGIKSTAYECLPPSKQKKPLRATKVQIILSVMLVLISLGRGALEQMCGAALHLSGKQTARLIRQKSVRLHSRSRWHRGASGGV